MKTRSFHRYLPCFVISIMVMMLFSEAVFAVAPSAQEGTGTLQQIHLPFVSVGQKVYEWDFPYTDEFFLSSSEDFSLHLAQASMGLTLSAFRYNGDPIENQFETYLGPAGFTDIVSFGYDQETSKDSLSGIIASKKIGDFTLIAAAPNGWKYKKEWSSNLEVGEEIRHVGFNHAASIMESQINDYIREHGISGKMKLWISGFSRAAAVGNLTAADMQDSGRFEDVYAYLFGVPRTSKKAAYRPGIFNICGKYDPVTQVAPESWGFERYGTDLYTPSEETDTNYQQLFARASDVCLALTGHEMQNSPEINYQLHMILEFVYEMFPEPADYAEEFQGIIVKTWSDKSMDNILETLLSGLRQLKKLDKRQEYSSEILKAYLEYILAWHLEHRQEEIAQGRWDPELSLSENIMREHMPYTYLSWLFSDNPEHPLLYGHAFTRRVCVTADADVEVLKEGLVIGGVDRQGTAFDAPEKLSRQNGGTGLEADTMPRIYAIRSGSQTVVNLPMNDEYTIRIRTYGPETVLYYDVSCSPFTTFGHSDKMYAYSSGAGVREIVASYAEPLSPLRLPDGKTAPFQSFSFSYSPTVLMTDMAVTADHISISDLLKIILYAFLFTEAVAVICLVIYLLHRKGRRMGVQYSEMYIIVPHILLSILFGLLTQLFTVNIFSIGIVRAFFACLAVFMLFLLALRGTLRDRCRRNWIITVFLLVVSIANILIYRQKDLIRETGQNFLIYSIAMIALMALAVSTFYRKQREYMKDPVRNPTRVY